MADEVDRSGAFQEHLERQLNARLQARFKKAKVNESGECEHCGCAIPEARLALYPHVTSCVPCLERLEKKQ